MTHKSRFATLLFLFLLLGACGGGGGGGTPAAPTQAAASLALLTGGVGGFGYFDGVGSAAKFRSPLGLAVDSAENVYVADSGNGVVRKIAPSGATTTLAGLAGQSGFADGAGSQARFGRSGGNSGPVDVAVDAAGNVYVADTLNHSIRKISPAGIVTTLAGDGTPGSADGRGNAARFKEPGGLAVDGAMNVYVVDTGNHTLRKIASDGTVTTIAGSPGVRGDVDGPSTEARFNAPSSVAVDAAGTVYIASYLTIRKRATDGLISTLVPAPPLSALENPAGHASYVGVGRLATDRAGNLYATDTLNASVRSILANGVVTTFAGRKGLGCPRNGPADTAAFWSPGPIAVGPSGTVYVGEGNPSVIRAILPSRNVITLAGDEGSCEAIDGALDVARFINIGDLKVDAQGTLYAADTGARVVRSVPKGTVATLPSLYLPTIKLALGPASSIFAIGYQYPGSCRFGCDWKPFGTLWRVTASGALSSITPATNSDSSGMELGAAGGLVADAAGTMYWTDGHFHVIRKLSSSGDLTVLAGTPGIAGSTDGTRGAARFNAPAGIVMDGAGNFLVADGGNHAIRRIAPDGTVTTFAGSPAEAGNADGPAAAARFSMPGSLALDSDGDLYVADVGSCTVRKIAVSGVVTTVAGSPGQCGFAPGPLPGALEPPTGLAIFGSDLYIAMSRGIAVVHQRP